MYATNPLAACRPRPRLPPVTTATFPSSLKMFSKSCNLTSASADMVLVWTTVLLGLRRSRMEVPGCSVRDQASCRVKVKFIYSLVNARRRSVKSAIGLPCILHKENPKLIHCDLRYFRLRDAGSCRGSESLPNLKLTVKTSWQHRAIRLRFRSQSEISGESSELPFMESRGKGAYLSPEYQSEVCRQICLR